MPAELVEARPIVCVLAEMAPGLPYASSSWTVSGPAAPAIRLEDEPAITAWLAAAGTTLTVAMPVIVLAAESVAVIV